MSLGAIISGIIILVILFGGVIYGVYKLRQK